MLSAQETQQREHLFIKLRLDCSPWFSSLLKIGSTWMKGPIKGDEKSTTPRKREIEAHIRRPPQKHQRTNLFVLPIEPAPQLWSTSLLLTRSMSRAWWGTCEQRGGQGQGSMISFLFKQNSEKKRRGRGRRRRREVHTSWRAAPARDLAIWRSGGTGGDGGSSADVCVEWWQQRCTRESFFFLLVSEQGVDRRGKPFTRTRQHPWVGNVFGIWKNHNQPNPLPT
jgi:hypothetical protein